MHNGSNNGVVLVVAADDVVCKKGEICPGTKGEREGGREGGPS